jgi:nucleoid-associated protein YgaU
MGWFRSDPPVVDFEAVIDTDGVTWQAFTDDDGVLVIDTDAEVEVFVNRAVVGG